MPHFKNLKNELFWLEEGENPQKWLASDCVQITEQEANQMRLANDENLTYRQLRAMEYPPIGDQLDALYHAGIFPAEMAAQIRAVKDKYPKTT